jgi:hypothetical protein
VFFEKTKTPTFAPRFFRLLDLLASIYEALLLAAFGFEDDPFAGRSYLCRKLDHSVPGLASWNGAGRRAGSGE